MPSRIDDLRRHTARLEHEVEEELLRARERWRDRIEAGRVRFERDARRAHKRLKQSIPRFIRESSPLNLLTAPVIYSLTVPIALLDLWISAYPNHYERPLLDASRAVSHIAAVLHFIAGA